MSQTVDILQSELASRQLRNRSYSLRSFARDLGLNPGTLSSVLAGRRDLPKKAIPRILKALSLSEGAALEFQSPAGGRRAGASARYQVDNQALYQEVLAQWEHFAVLSLMDVPDFRPECPWIGTRLGISAARARVVTERLISTGFITVNPDGTWGKSHPNLSTTEDQCSRALRSAQMENLELAKEKLAEVPVELRDFSSITVAMDMARMSAIKHKIRAFRKEVEFLAESGSSSEVYQLCIQFFPLSQTEPEGEFK